MYGVSGSAVCRSLFLLAAFNNFVMIAAPTFPARATFSSVCFILVGTLAILHMPEMKSAFAGTTGRILKTGGVVLGDFWRLRRSWYPWR